tara:strand:- start:1135 stop:1671 length:537 start_codon:yes stop_codon:yes gene_type:complete
MANGILKVGEITTSSGSGSIILGQSGETITSSATMGSGMGKILQVVSATDSTERSTTSSSYVTGSNTLSVSITPASTSNKVLLIANLGSLYFNTSNQTINTTIYRDSTNLGTADGLSEQRSTSNVGYDWSQDVSLSFLDSPSSTSALTYQVYFKTSASTANLNKGSATASIVAMEVAG